MRPLVGAPPPLPPLDYATDTECVWVRWIITEVTQQWALSCVYSVERSNASLWCTIERRPLRNASGVDDVPSTLAGSELRGWTVTVAFRPSASSRLSTWSTQLQVLLYDSLSSLRCQHRAPATQSVNTTCQVQLLPSVNEPYSTEESGQSSTDWSPSPERHVSFKDSASFQHSVVVFRASNYGMITKRGTPIGQATRWPTGPCWTTLGARKNSLGWHSSGIVKLCRVSGEKLTV